MCPQVPTSGASQEHPVELEDNEEHGEPTPKRAGKRVQKAGSPQRKKKKPANAAKVPPVRVSDSGRKKIIVLNVVGLLCDIRPLHDRREWGPDLVIRHVSEFNVKIIKRANCDMFLSMLSSKFDVGIWSPIENSLLEVVAAFLAAGTDAQWSFLWGRSYPLQDPVRNLRNLFRMIPDPTHGATRCLQVDCDATATARSPPSNVLNVPRWDPLTKNDDFLARICGPFEALGRKQSDMKYCVANLTKEVGLASLEMNLVGTSEHVTSHSHARTTRQTCYLL